MPGSPRHRLGSAALAVLLAGASAAWGQTNIAATKHNLTSSGPGTVKVAGATDLCKFCHTPHASNPIGPLWNRGDPGTYYQTYASPTLISRVGQPTGSSRLCLSCHDGTIALAQTYNPRNAPTGTIYISSGDKGYLGTDLRDDHPISFLYDSGLAAQRRQLRDPNSLPRELALDKGRQLQCTTCHDPHSDRFGKFLTMSNVESAMCKTCHQLDNWDMGTHANSTASLAPARRDKWDNITASTVRQAACESCHRPHSAGGRLRLLRHEAGIDNCLPCHDGSVASKDLTADMTKLSSHPLSRYTGIHEAAERPWSMPKHVECADCHNAHTSRAGSAPGAPAIKPSSAGVSGMTGDRQFLPQAVNEYQICYKCHAGPNTVRNPVVDRVIINTNVADQFASVNPSFHPIEVKGKNTAVPSLILPLRSTSIIYCTDCHASDSAQGPRGPHGSTYTPLLVRQYVTADFTSEGPTVYALCYGCHNRSSILANQSFPFHSLHLGRDVKAPCSACHTPHGLSAVTSTSASGAHLINFDRHIALPLSSGNGPNYTSTGIRSGACNLTCHQVPHTNFSYSPSSASALNVRRAIRSPAQPPSPSKKK
ncbi:MAG: multiheme c-type cytochrome [Planctomycetota bacterium]|nr:multiheme c-type cytochrome [Planctomycetota bacterium]